MTKISISEENGMLTATSTVEHESETFVIKTRRDPKMGDTIFIKQTNVEGVTRLITLPPRVVSLIHSKLRTLDKKCKAAAAALKPKRVMSITTQIKMVQGGLASPKTPKHLLPSMAARLEKLLALQATQSPA